MGYDRCLGYDGRKKGEDFSLYPSNICKPEILKNCP